MAPCRSRGCSSGSVYTGLAPPEPWVRWLPLRPFPGPRGGGGGVLGVTGGAKREREAASELPLATPGRHLRLPTKSLYPALNLMTQIRALKVFGTDRTRSFINNDLHIDV